MCTVPVCRISLSKLFLPDEIPKTGHDKLNTNQALGVQVATPVGNLIGQLFFGWLADRVGRKRMCELILFA